MSKKKLFITFFIATILFSNNLHAKDAFFAEGEKLFKQKQYAKSKFKFEKDIVFNPKSEKSYLYLAKIFKKQNNENLEEKNLKTVILLNPKNEEALYLLALLKIKKSDFSESEKLINNFVKVCNFLCEKEKQLNIKLKDIQTK